MSPTTSFFLWYQNMYWLGIEVQLLIWGWSLQLHQLKYVCQGVILHVHNVPLGIKGCICHFIKCQIHPFIFKARRRTNVVYDRRGHQQDSGVTVTHGYDIPILNSPEIARESVQSGAKLSDLCLPHQYFAFGSTLAQRRTTLCQRWPKYTLPTGCVSWATVSTGHIFCICLSDITFICTWITWAVVKYPKLTK